ncbi:MAG: hypothetical protein ACYTBP_13215 [Planctomycetota bacterium]|jgi:hypothetical protein
MDKSSPCRLSLIFARNTPITVILRRGPSRWVEVIKWDTQSDTFEYGQWMHGRIYAERCGLSPDGKLFVYFVLKHGKIDEDQGYEQSFTAVSKPPYLTALAMWPHGDTWGGGGRFIDNKTLRLAYGKYGTFHPDVGDTEIYMAPLPDVHPKHRPKGLKIETNLDYYDADRGFKDTAPEHIKTEWYGRDHADRIIFVRGGKLFCVNNKSQEVLLHDFNDNVFRQVESAKWVNEW